MRKKQETSGEVQIIELVLSSKAHRKRWAALIQKVWQKDPMVCPRCGERMSIIAFIDEFPVVQKILESMDLWKIPERPPPKPLPRDLYEYDEYECAS
ncbi:MAG: hypothetical protein AB2L14_12450 [Candidatus Xenobiia bacterium LiM19]